MKVLRTSIVAVAIVTTLIWWSQRRAARPPRLPFDAVQYDNHRMILSGTETNLQARVSHRGNSYFTFDLDTGSGRLRIFEFGMAPCRAQSRVTVEGIFHHVKHVSDYTFYDQIDAERITCHEP
jgi:hypothetical protein